MYFEERARQACGKFIEHDKDISLLRLRQYMFLLERVTVLSRNEPFVNGTIFVSRLGPLLRNVDMSYIREPSTDDGELSPSDILNIRAIAVKYANYAQWKINKHLLTLPENRIRKREINYIDIMRANGIDESHIKEAIGEFEYYLSLLKELQK